MTILVIAEHSKGGLAEATKSTITAASQIGGDIDVLIFGADSACLDICAKQAASLASISKVIVADNEVYKDFLAENIALLIKEISPSYGHILAPASTFGKDFMPRVAAILDVAQVSDIVAIESADTFIRPIYAGNALARVKSGDAIKVITVRPSAFDRIAEGGSAAIENIDFAVDAGLSSFVSKEESASVRPELTSARVVVSGGRGVGSAENFALIEQLADKLGGAVGASRVAVDSGFVSNDLQVGQTGKIVAPELYIAVGISGAIQHLAGMKESKVIVAINKDENAPIFEIADYGLVGDLFEILPELAEKL